MTFKRIEIENLRCLAEVVWEPRGGLNVIVGANGAGKTSVLEAVALAATGRVLRTGGVRGACRKGASRLRVTVTHGSGMEGAVVGYESGAEGKVWMMDGQVQRSAFAILRQMPVMVINPEAHYVALQDGVARRAATHWTLFHVEPLFLEIWRRYQRVLRQRNAALRQGTGLYRMFDQGLAQLGEALLGLWERLYGAIGPRVSDYTQALGVQGCGAVALRVPWSPGSLEEALKRTQGTDERLGYTQMGAHRLDLKFFLEEEPLQTVGSHGQQKLVVSAWRLALAEYVARQGKTPTLLVDDVAAELDTARRTAFYRVLQESGAQTIATATEEPGAPVPATTVFHVEQGRFPV